MKNIITGRKHISQKNVDVKNIYMDKEMFDLYNVADNSIKEKILRQVCDLIT